jgi:nucleoside-diphosphate-sugar epimerase
VSLRGQKIFVTGATGFIGGRLVEKLVLEEGVEVVALVRRFMNASRLARFSIKMVGGDVLDRDAIIRGMEGCSLAVHCAIDGSGTTEENRRVTVEGTRNFCTAAEESKLRRVVHLSTVSVYGATPPCIVDEKCAKNPHSDPYGTSKLEAENIVLQYVGRGLPVTVLQPTVVFGPWAYWTTSTAALLGKGSVVLPDDGAGYCNAVYVDDVIQSILCALKCTQPVTGPYLISGPEPITWADYFRVHSEWIPGSTVIGEPLQVMERRYSRQEFVNAIAPTFFSRERRLKISEFVQNYPGIWQFYNKSRGRAGTATFKSMLAGAEPVVKPDPSVRFYPPWPAARFMALRSQVSIKKAEVELGYQPRFNIAKAMQIVGPWLQWAGLAPRKIS